jgi:hypothetical protein
LLSHIRVKFVACGKNRSLGVSSVRTEARDKSSTAQETIRTGYEFRGKVDRLFATTLNGDHGFGAGILELDALTRKVLGVRNTLVGNGKGVRAVLEVKIRDRVA